MDTLLEAIKLPWKTRTGTAKWFARGMYFERLNYSYDEILNSMNISGFYSCFCQCNCNLSTTRTTSLFLGERHSLYAIMSTIPVITIAFKSAPALFIHTRVYLEAI